MSYLLFLPSILFFLLSLLSLLVLLVFVDHPNGRRSSFDLSAENCGLILGCVSVCAVHIFMKSACLFTSYLFFWHTFFSLVWWKMIVNSVMEMFDTKMVRFLLLLTATNCGYALNNKTIYLFLLSDLFYVISYADFKKYICNSGLC